MLSVNNTNFCPQMNTPNFKAKNARTIMKGLSNEEMDALWEKLDNALKSEAEATPEQLKNRAKMLEFEKKYGKENPAHVTYFYGGKRSVPAEEKPVAPTILDIIS